MELETALRVVSELATSPAEQIAGLVGVLDDADLADFERLVDTLAKGIAQAKKLSQDELRSRLVKRGARNQIMGSWMVKLELGDLKTEYDDKFALRDDLAAKMSGIIPLGIIERAFQEDLKIAKRVLNEIAKFGDEAESIIDRHTVVTRGPDKIAVEWNGESVTPLNSEVVIDS